MKTQKLKLNELKIESFVTAESSKQLQTIKGGLNYAANNFTRRTCQVEPTGTTGPDVCRK